MASLRGCTRLPLYQKWLIGGLARCAYQMRYMYIIIRYAVTL